MIGRNTVLTLAAGAAGMLAARQLRARRRIDFRSKTILITGGSRGLGLELARRFAGEGARLVLLARDPDELERAREELAACGAEVAVFTCDVGDREAARRTVRTVGERFGGIDVLVNNAGVIQVGPQEHMQLEDFQEAVDVHTWGPFHLMRAALPYMHEGGRIVNVASIGGLVAVPHLLPYVMSKFALVGLSDGMRAELAKDGIRVTTVCPGLMRTGSHVNALFKGQHAKEFSWFSLSNASPLNSIPSARAAQEIVEAARYGDAHLTLTLPARLLRMADAVFPSATAAAMKLANRALPAPTGPAGDEPQPGRESPSAVAPSPLTRPADKMITRNNEAAPDQDTSGPSRQ